MLSRIHLPFFFLVTILWLVSPVQAKQPPVWVTTFGTSSDYPTYLYLVGFGSANGVNAEAAQIAQDNARAAVSQAILVKINSLLQTVTEETNQKFSQYLSSVTQSSTSLQLMGLHTEQYEEIKQARTYVLAYVSRAELQRIYAKRQTDLREQIRRILTAAQADEKQGKVAEAVTKYMSLYPLYEELKEVETVLLVASQSSAISDAFEELGRETQTSTSGSSETSLLSPTEVTNRISQLLSQSLRSVDDVARYVVFQLSQQVQQPKGPGLITPLTYRDTKMSSPFARYFREALETQLGQMVKWSTVSQTETFQPKSSQIMRDLAKASGAAWLFTGTYWEQGEQIKVQATLREVDTGKILAGADVVFDASILKAANLSPKPENYEQALIEQRAFGEGEIVSGQLQVEVWMNKGNEHVLYTEGEIAKVYVRVNREARIRLLYILADGRRTVLYDDLYIDQSKVNRVVGVPEEFECATPFGAEMLVVVARLEKFEPLETVEEDGYFVLKASTAQEAAAMTRGLKKRKPEAGEIQQTEAKLVITTMAK